MYSSKVSANHASLVERRSTEQSPHEPMGDLMASQRYDG